MKPGDSWRQFLSSFRKYVDLVELYKKRMVPALFSYLHSSLVEKVLALKLSKEEMLNLELCLPRLKAVLDGPSSDMTNRIVLA